MLARLLLVALLSVGSLVVTATPARAVGAVDQEQLDVCCGWNWGPYPTAQTFTAGITGPLDSVAVHPWGGFPLSGYPIQITTVDQGLPTTTVLASATITSSEYNTWVTTSFASPPWVVAGTQYAIVITPPGSTSLYITGGPAFADRYGAGAALRYVSGAWEPSLQAPNDIAFITYVTPLHQPDGWIRKGTQPYIGNDVFNSDGHDQTTVAKPRVGVTVLFDIAIHNDGNVSDRFTIQATGAAAPGYRIRYYRNSTEITAAVVSGTFMTPKIAPGGAYAIEAVVKAKSSAGPRATRFVTLTSVHDPTREDTVKFVVRPH
jgi:hypothetical protein